MPDSFIYNAPCVNSVFHPTDFSEASSHAFAHALAIALHRKTRFTILHAAHEKNSWLHFPSVRTTLTCWGLLDTDSQTSAVFDQLDIKVEKISLEAANPLKAIVTYLADKPNDLIVLATEGREGLSRWIRPSMAERIAHRTDTMTLFVQNNSRGFVSPENGKLDLKRILIPVDFHPSPLPAIEYAVRACRFVGGNIEIILCHVGKDWKMSSLELPEQTGITWSKKNYSGNTIDTIIKISRDQAIDLIVMSTAGHDGVFDALRGSVTEQVLRQAPCPLLAVPTN
jgi:nucleotide-binding universal stress UspA family protein